MKTALVLGAGGFIGSHMVKRLKKEGYWVRGVDLKYPEFSKTEADEFIIGDLRHSSFVADVMYLMGLPLINIDLDSLESVSTGMTPKQILDLMMNQGIMPYNSNVEITSRAFDLVFQYAADMGGANYIFSGEHDADVMHNSAQINLNVAHWASKYKVGLVLYSSSACIYPQQLQENENNEGLKESDAYPVNPDSEYGYEKIFSERVYKAYNRNYGLNIRIVRFHNVFGEEGTIDFLKSKAPAAIARKVAEAEDGGVIEIMGDGLQTRSFLYIDEAIDGCLKLINSNYTEPVNIGSSESISINNLAKMVIDISGKRLTIKNIPSNAIGVRGRNSDNDLIKEVLGWSPSQPLKYGIEKLYHWIRRRYEVKEYSLGDQDINKYKKWLNG